MADPVNWNDPCARAAALRSAYFARLSGQQEERVRFRNGDTEEDVSFAAVDLKTLGTELEKAEAQCAAATSGRPSRFAATAG